MDQNLAYLHEALSNYTEENASVRDIAEKIRKYDYSSEESFVRQLEQEEIQMLSQVLDKEINYANKSGDLERGYQLNGVFELLI